MNWILLAFIIIVVAVLVITTVVFIKKQMESDPFYYLNTNSTYATKTGYYNASDLGYQNMRVLREEKEKVFEEIKRFVNAKPEAKVILNSGATESIATCINWAKHYNKYGKIYGTEFDHSAVEQNCKNQDVQYEKIDLDEPVSLNENVSGIFITHANSKTGEIIPDSMLDFQKQIVAMQNMKSDFELESKSMYYTQYKPLVFMDVTQSITKTPIDMGNANALFFSLHKIGGPMNEGILVINEPPDKKFVPLIAGEQNSGLRGGTLNETEFVQNRDIFRLQSTSDEREDKWKHIASELKKNGVKYYEPKNRHLYNTFLIKVDRCPLSIVNELADKNIYVGTMSACSNENYYKHPELIDEHPTDAYIRLSFGDNKPVDSKCISTICKAINQK